MNTALKRYVSIFLFLAVVTLVSASASNNVGAVGGQCLTCADLDFQARCSAPGVLKCTGWDNAKDFVPSSSSYGDGLYPAFDGTYQGTMDTTIKASGAGSLRFSVRPFTSANNAGYWLANFTQLFSPHKTFYVQFRQRMDTAFVTYQWNALDGGSWKQYIIYYVPGPSCIKTQLVLSERYDNQLPLMYTACGIGLFTNHGVPPYLIQQGDYNCWYGNYVAPACFFYPIDTWVTWYLQVDVGDSGVANSNIYASVAVAGGPYKKFIDLPNYVLNFDAPGFNVIQLTTYMTHKNPLVATPQAYTWYDELIISTQPICAPNQ